MRAVITVIGKDAVGILANVSAICADYNANITDVTQSILQDIFAMIMLVDIEKINKPLSELCDEMSALGDKLSLSIHVMHEDIFDCMHKI